MNAAVPLPGLARCALARTRRPLLLAGVAVVTASSLGCGSEPATPEPAAAATAVRPVGLVDVAEPRSKGALAARRACRARTSDEVRRRFLTRARNRAPKAERRFLKSAAKPSQALRASPSMAFVAARVYALSLPTSERAGAYAGCAYALSQSLKESGR
jgi:hypothetical protein